MHYHVFKKNWSPLPKKKQFLLDAKNATDILIPLPKMPAPDRAPRRLDLWWQCPPPHVTDEEDIPHTDPHKMQVFVLFYLEYWKVMPTWCENESCGLCRARLIDWDMAVYWCLSCYWPETLVILMWAEVHLKIVYIIRLQYGIILELKYAGPILKILKTSSKYT